MSELDFDKVLQEHRGAYHNGHLKFQSSSFSFKNKKSNKTEQIQNEEIEKACWMRRAKGYCFKVMLKNGNNYTFDGFAENDYAKLDDYFNRHLKKSIEKQDMALKGWNWGKTNIQGDVLKFEIDNKPAFEIPLKNVSNTNATKNEAVLQFHQNDDAAVSLMEIRFHIPQNVSAAGGEENSADTAQEFIKSVMAKADLLSVSDGDSICTLTELNCVTPRGRYDVKFFVDFMDLHGKTFDYKISYEHILRLFLLPHKDGRQMYFVIAMDPPIKQGNTRYPFLIFLFNIDDEIDVELNISEKTKEKFGERIEKLSELSGPYHEVVSRICRIVLDKKITVPGNFTTSSGAKCYSCSYKAQSGFLYPLERGFIFVNKPAMHILFSDISMVKLDRSNQGTRSFDFEIENVNGTKYLFSGIDKAEQERLQEFVTSKGMKIAKSDKAVKQTKIGIDDDSHHDGYAERMKAEGRRGQQDDDDDDDDDDEDEDFEGESESEDDIEFDSDASIDTSSDEDDSDSEKKKKKKDKGSSPKKSKSSPSKEKSSSKSKSSSSSSKEKEKETNKRKASESSSKQQDKSNKKTKSPVKNEPKSAEFVETESDSD